ncbi:DinB family protein [Kutzneria sp. CA-103260]|uniref:DinB family protein n=1 Tax=Kutzneria sp. CA-103260 TaxID=2802641 RepID=UPI001BA81C66|nr:DinB family protein [Kutzneria sp. CA-103260]QUQ63774.1 DinB family protein [Kutzneria sp. CA-103260]
MNWNELLIDQADWHWRNQLRPRLEGLTDAEYLWEPVDGAWNVRPRGSSHTPMAAGVGDFVIDWEFPTPDPAPVTTIAWRIGHVVVGVFGMRVASHFGGPAMDYVSHDYPGDADTALAQLDAGYHAWIEGVRGVDLAAKCGPAEGEFAELTMAELVLHIHRELLHHGAEISLLRDLYRWR